MNYFIFVANLLNEKAIIFPCFTALLLQLPKVKISGKLTENKKNLLARISINIVDSDDEVL